MRRGFVVLLLGILFIAMASQSRPADALSTDDYVGYVRLKSYPNVEACGLTDGLGQCLSPIIDSFDKIGVVEITEAYTVWQVELHGSGGEKPVALNVNGIWKDVSCFQDSWPNCWETLTFNIAPTNEVKIFSTEHSSMANHGFHLQWVKLYIIKATEATVDIDPDDLNLRSSGMFITAYVELESADVRSIDASTVLLNKAISPVLDEKYGFVTSEDSYITDHDEDGVLERMLKFGRSEVQALLSPGEQVVITISGNLYDGMRFEGTDTIQVLVPPEMTPVGLAVNRVPAEFADHENAEIEALRFQRTSIYTTRAFEFF